MRKRPLSNLTAGILRRFRSRGRILGGGRMEHNFRKRVLLARVSALAIMLGAGGAHPETIAFTGAEVTWTVPVTGL